MRCNHKGCKKKLTLTDFKCKCNKKFCPKHRLPEQHNCNFDFKKYNKDEFIKKNGLGGGQFKKVETL